MTYGIDCELLKTPIRILRIKNQLVRKMNFSIFYPLYKKLKIQKKTALELNLKR